jgi:hypothetical protein
MANTTNTISTKETTKELAAAHKSVGQINKAFEALSIVDQDTILYRYEDGTKGGVYTIDPLPLSGGKTTQVDNIEDAIKSLVDFSVAGIIGTNGDVSIELNEDRTAVEVTIEGITDATAKNFGSDTIKFSISTDLTDKYEAYQVAKAGEVKMVIDPDTGATEEKLVRRVNGIVKQLFNEIKGKLTAEATINRKVKNEEGELTGEIETSAIKRVARVSKNDHVWYPYTEVGGNNTKVNKAFKPVNEWAPTITELKEITDEETGEVIQEEIEVGGFKPCNLVNGGLVSSTIKGFDTTVYSNVSAQEATVELTACSFGAIKKNANTAIEELVEAVGEAQSVKFAAYAHLVEINVEDVITVTFPRAFFRNGAPKRYEATYGNLDTDVVTIELELPNSPVYDAKGNNISRFQKEFREQYRTAKEQYKVDEANGNGVTLLNPPKSEEEKAAAKAKREA